MGYKELHDRVENLAKDVSGLQTDISSIKTQVVNHLPTMLDEIKTNLKTLDDRVIPLETKLTKSTGVSEFLSLILKAVTAMAAATWTVIQIIRMLYPHG